jgi:hypothetical protein
MYLEEIMNEFGIDKVSSDLSIPISSIPRQKFDNYIYVNSKRRCKLVYKEINNQGRYGLIQKCHRIVNATYESETVVVKRPRSASISLAPEAILQAVCFKTVVNAGLVGSIAKPHDIFLTSNEVRYTMEYIDGISFQTFLKCCSKSEKAMFCCRLKALIFHRLRMSECCQTTISQRPHRRRPKQQFLMGFYKTIIVFIAFQRNIMVFKWFSYGFSFN